MLDWDKLEGKKFKTMVKIIEKEGTEEERIAFRCATYLKKAGAAAYTLFYAGMHFTNIKGAVPFMPTSIPSIAQYLFMSMSEKQLIALENLLLSITISDILGEIE